MLRKADADEPFCFNFNFWLNISHGLLGCFDDIDRALERTVKMRRKTEKKANSMGFAFCAFNFGKITEGDRADRRSASIPKNRMLLGFSKQSSNSQA